MKITLKHLKASNFLAQHEKNLDLNKVETFLIMFTGDKTIKQNPYEENFKLFEKYAKELARELAKSTQRISPEIELNGRRFKLLKQGKQTIGWMIDALSVTDKTPASRVVSLCYIPAEQTHYGETTEDEALIADSAELEELFNEHLPLHVYYQCHAFFLKYAKKLLDKQKEVNDANLLIEWTKRQIKKTKAMWTQ